MKSKLVFISLLSLMCYCSLTTAQSKKTQVYIRGSSVDVFCPFGATTTAFEGTPLRSFGKMAELDVQKGHLIIPEVKQQNNGLIFCSNGSEKVLATRLVIMKDPQHYVPRLIPPRLFLGGPFHLECRLSVKSKKKAFVRFLVDGKESPEGDFMDYRTESEDPLVFLFWFNRSFSVQGSDVGRSVQCEARVPPDEPCCPRSEKKTLTIENPLQVDGELKTKRDSLGRLELTFNITHHRPLKPTDVAIVDQRGNSVCFKPPEISPVGTHLSTATITCPPSTTGHHYVRLEHQYRSIPFYIVFESQKKASLSIIWEIAAAFFITFVMVMGVVILQKKWKLFSKMGDWIRKKFQKSGSYNVSEDRDPEQSTLVGSDGATVSNGMSNGTSTCTSTMTSRM